MSQLRNPAGLVGTLLLLAQLWPNLCSAENVKADFCSTLNTADGDASMSIYQTQGLCRDECTGKYAFAVLNYQSCWCTNYEPAKSDKVDDDECDTKCPAYTEWCGGKDDRYGYLALGKTPEGTKSSNDDDDETSSTSSTVTSTSSQTSTTISSSSSSSEVSSSFSTSTSSPTLSTAAGGETVTITPTGVAAESGSGSGSGGLSGGAIAGIVVGVVGGVIAAALAGFFFLRRKRAQEGANGAFDPRSSNSTAFTDLKDAAGLAAPGAALFAGGQAGDRQSRLMPADPRMDPYSDGLYVRTKSRESVNTLHDEQDYSRRILQPRVLRATNPDPDQGD